jgi:hypothetical protein
VRSRMTTIHSTLRFIFALFRPNSYHRYFWPDPYSLLAAYTVALEAKNCVDALSVPGKSPTVAHSPKPKAPCSSLEVAWRAVVEMPPRVVPFLRVVPA